MPEKKPTTCECGKPMTQEDADFWGECPECREQLPIQTANHGDKSGACSILLAASRQQIRLLRYEQQRKSSESSRTI